MLEELTLEVKKGRNKLYINNYGDGYLVITDQKWESSGNKPLAARFTGGWLRPRIDGSQVPIYQHIAEFIADHGRFYSGRFPKTQKSGDPRQYKLVILLYALYHGLTYDEAEQEHPYRAFVRPILITGEDKAEREFIDNHTILDFSTENICGNTHVTMLHTNGYITQDPHGDTMISVKDKLFYVNSADGKNDLNQILKYQTWSLPGLNKAANVNLGVSGESAIPLAQIVWGYCHGMVTLDNKQDVRAQLVRLRKYFREQNLVVDHLTEQVENNRPYAIAAMDKAINQSLKNWRTQIGAPYFFYSSYDHQSNQCLVWCGIRAKDNGLQWERYIVFGDLREKEEAQKYAECVKAFRKRIPKEYTSKETKETSLLRYWATTANGYNDYGGAEDEENNPLLTIFQVPKEKFVTYTEDIFDNLPQLST